MQISLWVVSLIDVATAQVIVQSIHADVEAATLDCVEQWAEGCMIKGKEWDTDSIVDDGKRVWDHKEHVIDV